MSRETSDSRAAAPPLIDVAKVAGASPISLSRALGCPELIGFGDLSCVAHTYPPLTTVRIGRAIAEALLARQPLRLDVGAR